MKTLIALPLALVLATVLAAAFAPSAQAAPVTSLIPATGASLGGVHVGIGFGVTVPIGHGQPHRAPYAHPGHGPSYRTAPGQAWYPAPSYVPAGHWEYREEQVWVPGSLVGYDRWGTPVYDPGYWTVRATRVWVPEPIRYYRPARPHGYVGWGFGYRAR